jgi:hypothetical protein
MTGEVTLPRIVLDQDDLLVGASALHGVGTVADHDAVLPIGAGLDGGVGQGEEQLETGHRVERRIRCRQRDRERTGGVICDDSRDHVSGAVETSGPAFEERDEVAVVTGQVRSPLPGLLECAGVDRIAVAERRAVSDHEGPHAGIVVGRDRLGHQRHDLGIVGIAGIDLGQTVIDGIDDLIGIQGAVQVRVDVLGWITDEGAEIDELAPVGSATIGSVVGTIGSRCVVRRGAVAGRRISNDKSMLSLLFIFSPLP